MPAKHKPSVLLAFVLAASLAVPKPAHSQAPSEQTEAAMVKGVQALQESDFALAASSFREILEADPSFEPALLGLSEALAQQGDSVAALTLARQAVQLRPDSAPATLAVARQLAQLGASVQALEALSRLRALDPNEIQGYRLSALLLRDLRRGDEAIRVLEMALERGLRDARLEEELAVLLLAADRPSEASERAAAALAEHGETAGLQVAYGLAIVAVDPTARDQAIELLERAIELGLQNPAKVHLELSSLLLEAKRPDEGIEQLELAKELMPESPQVYYKLGVAQRTTGDASGAQESLTRFQELKAENERLERLELEVGTTLNQIQELASSNRLYEALESLDALLVKYPDEFRVHILRAKILYSMQRQGEALAAIKRARELDPAQIEPLYLEGMFLLQLNRAAEARVALEQAISLEPNLGEAYVLLGGAWAKLGDPAQAITSFERALELGTDSPSLRLGYSAALESLGRLDESAQQDEAYRRLTQPPR